MKKLLAEVELDKEMLTYVAEKKMVIPNCGRSVVDDLMGVFGVSQRRDDIRTFDGKARRDAITILEAITRREPF